jgi:glutathionylspermidine synthase
MQDIGWDGRFVDSAGRPLRALFKLYPWEGLLADEFAPHIAEAPQLRWIEPAWKLLLASKGILGLLWRLFPDHPNLLPASRHPLDGPWVRKPFFGREGSNVTVAANGVNLTTSGPYESGDFVYQAYTELGVQDGVRPVVGSWIIGGEAAGVGIRECAGYVTDNTASFVPHVIA